MMRLMKMKLPQHVDDAITPLFAALPLDEAMTAIVVTEPVGGEPAQVVESLDLAPELMAGLWLYVDDLDRSHTISQGIDTPTGAFWHGIMHRREGDFSNSHYWFRQVGEHPAFENIGFDYDPHRIIDEAQATHQSSEVSPNLVDIQHREWLALFEWCANR